MQLTWRFILKNIVPILAAIVTIAGNIFVLTYYRPDVRYETGAYYRTNDIAVTYLKLTNYGYGDAEDIRVSASFPQVILDVKPSDDTIDFSVKAGGKGFKNVVLKIDRLVSDQSIDVFFAIKDPDGPITSEYHNFIQGIYPKNGSMAKKGKPIPLVLMAFFFGSIVFCGGLAAYLFFDMKKMTEEHKRWIKDQVERRKKEKEEHDRWMDDQMKIIKTQEEEHKRWLEDHDRKTEASRLAYEKELESIRGRMKDNPIVPPTDPAK